MQGSFTYPHSFLLSHAILSMDQSTRRTNMFLETAGVIAICRKIYGEDLLFLTKALHDGGIRCIEVTFDQQENDPAGMTSAAISDLRGAFPDMHIGAGTVINEKQLLAAHEAGAEFIISPNADPVMIRKTRELGMFSIPGAMTPTEIIAAWDAGANFVKIFPAANLGAGYIKAIRSPISHIPMMAVGGIGAENFADFLKAGCCGAGIGGSLCSKKLVAERDGNTLRENAAALMKIYRDTTEADRK